MAKHYQDFVGLNTFIYEPVGWDLSREQGNAELSESLSNGSVVYFQQSEIGFIGDLGDYKNVSFPFDLPTTASFFNALMSHRGDVYGYPIWKQIRVSNNPLTRKQRKNNIFTYTKEPGQLVANRYGRYGQTVVAREPVVTDSNKPLSLVGDVSVYNERQNKFQNRAVELKTSFGNETSFFTNKEVNEYFDTILETDDNYENLKELYLDGGLEDDASPIDAFNLLVYRQTVFPKQQYAYLDETRSRKHYENLFWRDLREDRTRTDVDNGFQQTVPSQSIWPLDADSDFATRPSPKITTYSYLATDYSRVISYYVGGRTGGDAEIIIGTSYAYTEIPGFNTGEDLWSPAFESAGGEGILQNSYSQIARGRFVINTGSLGSPTPKYSIAILDAVRDGMLSASCYYSRLHTIFSKTSMVSPSGPSIEEMDFTTNQVLDGSGSIIDSGSLFSGHAFWDAPSQAGKKPFYDSYQDFASDTRLVGKGYSTVPEFRISNHVKQLLKSGPLSDLDAIFEISGATSANTTTENKSDFYKVLSTSDFLRHFDLVKKDQKELASEKIITLKCKAVKKFNPYKGFYPAERTVDLSRQFLDSYKEHLTLSTTGIDDLKVEDFSFGAQPLLTPLFAPGVLFNTIKSGVAVDFPLITGDDAPASDPSILTTTTDSENYISSSLTPANGDYNNYYISSSPYNNSSSSLDTIFNVRIPFESLVEPEKYLANLRLLVQEPHPFGLQNLELEANWSGNGDELYKKMANNILAEIPDFFLKNANMKSIPSLEEQDPEFGNAISGNYYTMRIKMVKSRKNNNNYLGGYYGTQTIPPQDLTTYQDRFTLATITDIPLSGGIGYGGKHRYNAKESLTMYSRPSAFGPPTYGGNGYGGYRNIKFREIGSWWGTNYPYTPPYYHGEAWCDLIFYATESKKYSLNEILSSSVEYPYYTRFWWNGTMDAVRDLTGYSGSVGPNGLFDELIDGKYISYKNGPWHNLIKQTGKTVEAWDGSGSFGPPPSFDGFNWGSNADSESGSASDPSRLRWLTRPGVGASTYTPQDYVPQHPFYVNYNAMQLDSSINIFGKGVVKEIDIEGDGTSERMEVASSDTIRGKTRWIIQPKFETPILNFNKYTNLEDNNCTVPQFASESVPRGMWHQYGELPEETQGVFLQVEDIPRTWLKGALGITSNVRNIASLADLVGFSKEPVRLGEVADVKEISEAVVAVPFIEKNGTRQFFSIPRADIDSCIEATRREVEPGNFPAGGPPKAGDSVYQMVKKMQKYVFPPSMDFVRYKEIDPFAMYVFEFKHNLSKQDLADIWQNLPPEIGIKMEEAEATISHELLAHELLGGGAVVKNGTLDDNAEGNGIPSNIQWMIFKAKKRAKTNYFDKVVAKKGTTEDTSKKRLENASGQTGDDQDITYNWPYDFFSLVELVKLDAEVTFANIENDDKGQKTIKKVEKKTFAERREERRKTRGFNFARGKGRPKK